MKLLYFSNQSGEVEYLVVVDPADCPRSEWESNYARPGCTLDAVFDIEREGRPGTIHELPLDTEFVKS